MRIVHWWFMIPFVALPPLTHHGQETIYPKGSLKWSSLNQSVQELRNKGAIEPAPLTPGFCSCLFLVTQATGEWRPMIDLSSLNVFVHCPSFTMEMPRSILGALQQGQWLTSQDAYFHIGINPADRRYLRFCHNGTAWQLTVLVRVVNQSESIYQNTQTGTSICPSPSGKIAHVPRRLVVKPRGTPVSSRANILAQVSVPKARVGYQPRENGSNPISGCHLSGDRAGHSCMPGKAITQESGQLAIHSGGIHGTETTCCAVAPSTWTPSFSYRETTALWSNAHSSHSMAIETPFEPVEGEILKTDSNRPSVPPGHPMVYQQGQFRKGNPNRDHGCGILHVHRQQYSGLGCPLAGVNCIWHLVPGPIPATHQCPGATSHMAWPTSWSEVAYLRNQGGQNRLSPNPHQLPSKRAQSFCLFLGVPPKLFPETGHGSGLFEKQQHVCFILPRISLSNGGCDYDGSFRGWSAGHFLKTMQWNKSHCWLPSHSFHCPEPGDTVRNGAHLLTKTGFQQMEREDSTLHSE